ncbi:MAG: hypothetical protein A2Y25_06620 [Candidatus Melainabacteria bacterium GWF2_37_15]|nr:MAG: hypothetical protein A2Y25_06620 [Candidatus Melainabacteria bacterium GWF2_37_15]
MNKIERRRLKRSADLKLIIFTFLGAFILFFAAFTYFLPIITPKVEVPALSEEYVLDSVTSQDFKGRVDPRLRSIELQEDGTPVIATDNDDEETDSDSLVSNEPDDSVSNEDSLNQDIEQQKPVEEKREIVANVPPRPKSLDLREKVKVAPPVPVYQAKVVVGDFYNPKEVKIASDILISLNYEPFVVERNGKYILQIASFSDTTKAEALVNQLRSRNFDAKIIYD